MARKRSNHLLKDTKIFVNLLLYEASGGVVGQIPKGKVYNPVTTIPFNDRRALIDVSLKTLAIEHKIDPEDEKTGFGNMKELLNGGSEKTIDRPDPFGRTEPTDEDDDAA